LWGEGRELGVGDVTPAEEEGLPWVVVELGEAGEGVG